MSGAFRGGTHPHDYKEFSRAAAITEAPVPDELVVPAVQHIGAPAKIIVKVGDEVKRGQVLAQAGGFVSAAVHSPVSGRVKKIDKTLHPMGMTVDAIILENDHKNEWAEGLNTAPIDWTALSADDMKNKISSAGIVGMGGATFPTHVKLSPPPEKKIDAVILNGVECEPFLTADDRLMRESPKTIVEGLRIVMKIVNAPRGIIGIEENKPEAIASMKQAVASFKEIEVKPLPVMYPQGAEKQLIVACLGREVPSGGLPMDAGAVVQNVGTANAIYEAVVLNRPLTERITSVTGPGIERPGNFRVRLGTPAKVLLDLCGFKKGLTKKLIYGGPMMGAAHYDETVPVNKGMSGILALTEAVVEPYRDCIRCGRCVDGCPAGLIPSEISILCERVKYLDTPSVNILDCIECGVCTYVCPARRPIVQWIKVAKSMLAAERARQQAADKAKQAAAK